MTRRIRYMHGMNLDDARYPFDDDARDGDTEFMGAGKAAIP
jgi:hypothetical protein